MRKPLMAGNWKMNLNHLEAIAVAQKLVYSLSDKDYDEVDIAIIPPFTDIRSIQTLVDGDRLRLQYGAQDLSPDAGGAFTGDISGSMLKKLGCTFVVIGHSERRAIHKEDDALVNRKIKAALANELIPIANPAIATEFVSCSVLKKIARPIIPYEIRAGRAASISTQAFGIIVGIKPGVSFISWNRSRFELVSLRVKNQADQMLCIALILDEFAFKISPKFFVGGRVTRTQIIHRFD